MAASGPGVAVLGVGGPASACWDNKLGPGRVLPEDNDTLATSSANDVGPLLPVDDVDSDADEEVDRSAAVMELADAVEASILDMPKFHGSRMGDLPSPALFAVLTVVLPYKPPA